MSPSLLLVVSQNRIEKASAIWVRWWSSIAAVEILIQPNDPLSCALSAVARFICLTKAVGGSENA
jgi:hypothetical protein